MSKVSIGEDEYEVRQICWRISSSICGCMKWYWMLVMALMTRWLRIWSSGLQSATQT